MDFIVISLIFTSVNFDCKPSRLFLIICFSNKDNEGKKDESGKESFSERDMIIEKYDFDILVYHEKDSSGIGKVTNDFPDVGFFHR